MGYNTSMIILNDALGSIERDANFGKSVAQAVRHMGCYGDEEDIHSRPFVNGATVIETHHADQISVVSFGDNCGVQITKPTIWSWKLNNGTDEGRVKILKEVADQLGYSLRRKPKR